MEFTLYYREYRAVLEAKVEEYRAKREAERLAEIERHNEKVAGSSKCVLNCAPNWLRLFQRGAR